MTAAIKNKCWHRTGAEIPHGGVSLLPNRQTILGFLRTARSKVQRMAVQQLASLTPPKTGGLLGCLFVIC
jgi:hypothetical protein